MVYVGAKDRTADQISKALVGGASRDEIIDYFSGLMGFLDSRLLLERGHELQGTNRVYVQDKVKLLESYKEVLKKRFHGAFESIDFNKPSDAAKVPMMKIKNPFPYYENDKVQVLGLPYKGNDIHLYVFLPKERFGLKKLIQEGSGKHFVQLILKAHENFERNKKSDIDVEIPRFKIETSLGLVHALQQLGIKDAFGDKADFSGITGHKDIQVSDTNEEGSEAAAATAVGIQTAPVLHLREPIFRADHPFLYTLSTKNGINLFVGTVAKFE